MDLLIDKRFDEVVDRFSFSLQSRLYVSKL